MLLMISKLLPRLALTSLVFCTGALLLIAPSFSIVANAHADGGAMTCGKKIIHAGDSKHLLISRFGAPESREFVGMVQRGNACVKAEEWLYVCRKNAKPKMYVIRVIGTTIVSIKWLPDVQ